MMDSAYIMLRAKTIYPPTSETRTPHPQASVCPSFSSLTHDKHPTISNIHTSTSIGERHLHVKNNTCQEPEDPGRITFAITLTL